MSEEQILRKKPNKKHLRRMVRRLKGQKFIKTTAVASTMLEVDRYYYSRDYPYDEHPETIGYGAIINAPQFHALILELLVDKLQYGEKALDVGCGSGYLTACMSLMLGNVGLVVGIDHIPQLVQLAEQNIRNGNPELLESGQVKLIVGDGRLGVPEFAPYNVICVGAASPDVPPALMEQLCQGGRLVIPIGPGGGSQKLEQIDKLQDGSIRRKTIRPVSCLPLTSKSQQWPWLSKPQH